MRESNSDSPYLYGGSGTICKEPYYCAGSLLYVVILIVYGRFPIFNEITLLREKKRNKESEMRATNPKP